MFGKLGTGKRTLATHIAIRLAKKEPKSRIRIVGERDLISKELDSMLSTIFIVQDPVKTWYTVSYTEEIISRLLKLCKIAKTKNSYILVIFHHDDLDSLYRGFGEKRKEFESMFDKVLRICIEKETLNEIAKSKNRNISTKDIDRMQKRVSSIGEIIKLRLFLKISRSNYDIFLSNPIMFIVKELKYCQMSSNIHNQSAFNLMVFLILNGGEIAKSKLNQIQDHALFDNLKVIDKDETIDGCIKWLLNLFIEESADGGSYRVVHDVITKCTILAASVNHMKLLLKECDPIILFDCIRLKTIAEKIQYPEETVCDYSNLKIAIPSEWFPMIARLSFERKEIIELFKNIRLFEDKDFQREWNKEQELHFKKKQEAKTSTDTRLVL